MNGVQMCEVALEQGAHLWRCFLLQAVAVIFLILLKGLAGIQRQELQRGLGAQKHGEGADAASDDLRGENGKVIRSDKIKNTLAGLRPDAVRRDAGNAHELPR